MRDIATLLPTNLKLYRIERTVGYAYNIKIKCNYLKLGFDWLLKLCHYYITFVRTQTVLQETPILNNCINPPVSRKHKIAQASACAASTYQSEKIIPTISRKCFFHLCA